MLAPRKIKGQGVILALRSGGGLEKARLRKGCLNSKLNLKMNWPSKRRRVYTKQREELCEGHETEVCCGCGVYREEDLGAGQEDKRGSRRERCGPGYRGIYNLCQECWSFILREMRSH